MKNKWKIVSFIEAVILIAVIFISCETSYEKKYYTAEEVDEIRDIPYIMCEDVDNEMGHYEDEFSLVINYFEDAYYDKTDLTLSYEDVKTIHDTLYVLYDKCFNVMQFLYHYSD